MISKDALPEPTMIPALKAVSAKYQCLNVFYIFSG
jgi:hypothetical protein